MVRWWQNAFHERMSLLKAIARLMFAVALLLSMTVPVSAVFSASKVTQGTVKLKDGSTYTGQLVNGIPHGKGMQTFPKGSVISSYSGEFKNGKFHGAGMLLYANGSKASGFFANGVLSKNTLLTALQTSATNYGHSLQTGKFYGDAFTITFTGYNPANGTFGGELKWLQYGSTDTLSGSVQGNKLVFHQMSNGQIASTITVGMTDSNHLSGTWNSGSMTGTIRFTINPGDVSHLMNTYKIYVPSSTATLETETTYITTTSPGALNGSVTILPDGTYVWNSLVNGKIIKGKWAMTNDIAYPIVLLKGEMGGDWKIGESVHNDGADIYLWDGVSSQKARLVK